MRSHPRSDLLTWGSALATVFFGLSIYFLLLDTRSHAHVHTSATAPVPRSNTVLLYGLLCLNDRSQTASKVRIFEGKRPVYLSSFSAGSRYLSEFAKPLSVKDIHVTVDGNIKCYRLAPLTGEPK